MSRLRNKVILIGRLGNDVEIVNFDDGGKIGKFTLATSSSYTNRQGEKVEDTQWHNIVVRNKTAEICEKYISKGDEISLEGSIRYRKFEKNGENRYFTEITVSEVLFLNSKKTNSEPEQNGVNEQNDDLPF